MHGNVYHYRPISTSCDIFAIAHRVYSPQRVIALRQHVRKIRGSLDRPLFQSGRVGVESKPSRTPSQLDHRNRRRSSVTPWHLGRMDCHRQCRMYLWRSVRGWHWLVKDGSHSLSLHCKASRHADKCGGHSKSRKQKVCWSVQQERIID